MNAKNQRILIWAGIVLSSVYFCGYATFMGFFPPPSPSLPAADVVQFYAQNNLQFRIGVALMIVAGGFYLPWTIVISIQMAKHEKGIPLWAITQGLAGTVGTGLFILAPIVWAVAAFSPERDPALTLLMHEFAFLTFITPVSVFPLQAIPIALIGLSAKSDESLSAFPRWIGYLTLWLTVTAEAGVAAVLFKTGPFAWNGLFPFYLPFGMFGIWVGALIFSLMRAIGRQERSHAFA